MPSPISPNEPVTELRRIRILECSEPMVDFTQACPNIVLDRPRYRYERVTHLRRSVAERLHAASLGLPDGYRLGVIEGWRAPHIQHRMYLAVWNHFSALRPDASEAALRRMINRYTAPIHPRVPPPHSTGGAVDVVLLYPDGKPHDHASPFAALDERGFPFEAAGLSDVARDTRALLRHAMTSAGFTNYPAEYWHWSYGDQGWAYRGGHAHAIYGPTSPEGWSPNPDELTDEPLEMLHSYG